MSGGAAAGPAPRRGGKGIAQAEAIDLDMTPMMNMLIILISFLVTMVVFTQLAVIKFGLPPSGAGAGSAAPPDTAQQRHDVDITLVISELGFQIIGEGRKLDPIPRGKDGYDYPRLGLFLRQLKQEYPGAESVVLLIDTSIVYQDVIAAMDVCRDNRFPNILLSGGVYQ